MPAKLTFESMQQMCQALGTFGEARSQNPPNKDIILTIKKIHGCETLEAVSRSQMSFRGRVIRSFGLGNSSLRSIARFVARHEPYLSKYSRMKEGLCLLYHYTEEAVAQVKQLSKEELKTLKRQKASGCEALKDCVAEYNLKGIKPIYMHLQENEKKDLTSKFGIWIAGTTWNSPNPMGPIDEKEEKKLREHYKVPVIEPKKFGYLDPFFKVINNHVDLHVLGFCYEFGLGADKDLNKAVDNYGKSLRYGEYSAFFNLARLNLKMGGKLESTNLLLNKAREILENKIHKLQDKGPELIIRKCQKALDKIAQLQAKVPDAVLSSTGPEVVLKTEDN